MILIFKATVNLLQRYERYLQSLNYILCRKNSIRILLELTF